METHHLKIEFGKHRGELWTRVPVSYLHWIVNNEGFLGRPELEIAQAELKRRGTVLPTIEISGHAIDRVSLRCRKIWHEDRNEDEGLHAWLVRIAGEAIEANGKLEKVKHKGMKLIFDFGMAYPTLKTIMRD